ncbi:cupin domain-containing protein [Massilia sp. Dwa41.01b]|uniref:cupin domain-containing protein n=1 Tax=unclassified Massilia TaxID=2609279 RepID=UPI001602D12B|nr:MULTISPECIES: cupin domain-containing protein [unclassified Massilia]QNA90779.1 cupin domain-containing protein [Massilia sp. Dwa41.01b]QNA98016.1 cupin domain-containing protein [Massilia sp. Se16.2.3]
MALQHAASGERIALQRGEDDIANFTSIALAKTEHMELIRLVVTKDKPMPEHRVEGEITLLCLEGELAVDAHGRTIVLRPNEMVYLAGGEPHAIRANQDGVALMTILLGQVRTGGPTNDPRGQAA